MAILTLTPPGHRFPPGIVAKIAPGAMILPIKVLDSDGNTDTFMVAQGIFHAIDQGVDVINLSIGST